MEPTLIIVLWLRLRLVDHQQHCPPFTEQKVGNIWRAMYVQAARLMEPMARHRQVKKGVYGTLFR